MSVDPRPDSGATDAPRKYRARPTVYRGIRMRSRLEAKVAALLDDIGKEWSYEGDAYASRHGQYLPDFIVGSDSELSVIEVKPLREMAPDAFEKMSVVWDTNPGAALIVVAPDSALHPALELIDGEAWVQFLTFPIMPCGHTTDMLLDTGLIRTALDVVGSQGKDSEGLSPVEVECSTCGERAMPSGFWGEADLDWTSALKLLHLFAFTSQMAIEGGAGRSLARWLRKRGGDE